MNNTTNVEATVTHNGANSRRDSSPDGEAVAYQPATVDVRGSTVAESVTFICDDIQ